MLTYSYITFILLTLSIASSGYVLSRFGRLSEKISATLVIAIISIYYGLRSPLMGRDTSEYIARYNNGTPSSDILFDAFSNTLHSLGAPSMYFLFAISLLTTIFLFWALVNFTKNIQKSIMFLALIAIMPYGIMMYTNIIRQGLAVSIILLGISISNKDRNSKLSIISLLSILIHKSSAIVYVISVFLKKVFICRKNTFLLFFIVMLIAASLYLLPTPISFIDQKLGDKYMRYASDNTSESTILIYVKFLWAYFHVILLSKMRNSAPNSLYSYFIATVCVATICISSPLVASRFLTTLDILLPMIYASIPGKKPLSYRIGIAAMILYAIISPFVFSIYKSNFGI